MLINIEAERVLNDELARPEDAMRFAKKIDAQFDSLGVPQTVQEMNLIKIRTLQLLSSVGSHFDSHQVSSTFAVGFSRSHHP